MTHPLLCTSWQDVIVFCQLVVANLQRSQFRVNANTKILTIARGGLIPATIISHSLDCANLQVLHKNELFGNKIKKQRGLTGKGWLVIDEICDTGETLLRIKEIYPDITTAVLVTKPLGRDLVEGVIFATIVPQEFWVQFPWEYNLENLDAKEPNHKCFPVIQRRG